MYEVIYFEFCFETVNIVERHFPIVPDVDR